MSTGSAPQSRMTLLTFVTVSVAAMAGVVGASLLLSAFLREDDTVPVPIGLMSLPMPAVAAALAFLFVTRWESGRKGLAAVAVLFGTLAATIVFAAFGLVGLVMASAAAGGFAVFARRLLDKPVTP